MGMVITPAVYSFSGTSHTTSSFPITIFPPGRLPTLILGPCRSCRMVMGLSSSPEICLMVAITPACSSYLPCEKFRRATSMPAPIICLIMSGELLAGPMVATIFVRRKEVCMRTVKKMDC